MKSYIFLAATIALLGGCASSSVQPMSNSSFQISSTTAPVCGRSAAPKIASKIAAIEVIRRGGDLFILEDAASDEHAAGMFARSRQAIIVRTLNDGQPGSEDALSARQVLGADWEKQVRQGRPSTCF
jgi:hypothetical protein